MRILSYLPGHDERALCPHLKDLLQWQRPVVVLGPPVLPARLHFKEAVGTTRCGYARQATSYKTMSISAAPKQGSRSNTTNVIVRSGDWERRVSTTCKVELGVVLVSKGCWDGCTSQDFWRAVLRCCREVQRGSGVAAASCTATVSVQFGDGRELSAAPPTSELLSWLHHIEISAI